MKTNHSRACTLNHVFYLAFILQETRFLCSNHPRARYQTTRDSPCTPEGLYTAIIPLIPSSAHLPLLFLSFPMETTRRAPDLAFPLLLMGFEEPLCFLRWPCVAWHTPLSSELWVTNYLFNVINLLIC